MTVACPVTVGCGSALEVCLVCISPWVQSFQHTAGLSVKLSVLLRGEVREGTQPESFPSLSGCSAEGKPEP